MAKEPGPNSPGFANNELGQEVLNVLDYRAKTASNLRERIAVNNRFAGRFVLN